MEIVVNVTSGDIDAVDLARRTEAAGFSGISCADHVFRTQAYPHVWVTAAAMAMATTTISIGTAFANNLFRSPVEFAQASLTMQQLSKGRFVAGLGAGWLRVEAEGGGYGFPSAAERARRYLEAVMIVRSLLREGSCRFSGEFYDVDVPVMPHCDVPPPLAVSVGGPWTTCNVAPLADIVELKFGASTRGGTLDTAALARASDDDVTAMVAAVRAVAPTATLSMFAMVAVGDGPEVDAAEAALGDGFYGRFVGEPQRVMDNLRQLASFGIARVQLSDYVKGSTDRLLEHAPG